MAEMKVEDTAGGWELVYRVYVHPEVFEWLPVPELSKRMTEQFEELLEATLYKIKEEK